MPSDKSDLLDDESDNDGSESGSDGTYALTFCFNESFGRVGKSVGCVSGVGSCVFVPTEIEAMSDIFCWLCSYQKELSQKVVDS